VRCPRCGNENQDGMRFCGMCGGTLLSPVSTGARGASAAPQAFPPAAPATRPPAPEEPRIGNSSPAVSGPSFLGLNDPPPASHKRANLSIDPHHAGARNLDYLLDDEDHHKSGGVGKFFLMVLALLLAVGLGYLRWKDQLPPWLNSIVKKPPAATQTSEQPPADGSTAASPGVTPEPQPGASQPAPTQPAPTQPVSNPTTGTTATSAQPPANQPAPTAEQTNSQPASDAGTPKSEPANPPDNSATKNPPASDAPPAAKSSTPAAKSDESSDEEAAGDPEPAAKPKTSPPAAKPRATIRPADSVAEARRYLYGRGAAQDCERGLRLLKPMASEGNSKAMVEMGALYSAGLCTPRDLPTAYRWFAVALRKDPSNEAIQTDLQKLWGEMTQPERQLAIKLTQ
jgi:hypothetical protein